MKNTKWWIIGGLSAIVLITLTSIVIKRRKRGLDYSNNIIIGDSQTPYIAKNTTKASLINKTGGESALWQSNKNVDWLRNAVKKYKKSPEIKNVVISIGTNSGFSKSDDIDGLFSALETTFPKAKFYVVKGSWGWGNNKNKTIANVNAYYQLYKDKGIKLINTPIGKVNDPHSNLPIYATISSEIDKAID